jgi:hypothetical protein
MAENLIRISYRKFKCPRGHMWEEKINCPLPVTLDLGTDIKIEALCPYCLMEFLAHLFSKIPKAEIMGEDK